MNIVVAETNQMEQQIILLLHQVMILQIISVIHHQLQHVLIHVKMVKYVMERLDVKISQLVKTYQIMQSHGIIIRQVVIRITHIVQQIQIQHVNFTV